MAILITGGSGFLAAALASHLLEREPEAEIRLADFADHPRLDPLRGRVGFVQADLTEPGTVERLLGPDVDTVFHLASLVSGGAEANVELGLKVNVHATLDLLEACRRAGHAPRFVFPSSIATFGGRRSRRPWTTSPTSIPRTAMERPRWWASR